MVDFKIVPTLFFLERGNVLEQVINIEVESKSDFPQAKLILETRKGNLIFDLGRISSGQSKYPINIPEVHKPIPVKFTLTAGKRKREHCVVIKPQKHWTIFLAQSIHTDIGYTDYPPIVAKLHNDNLDKVIGYCKKTDSWPDGSRFKWNCEIAWQVQNYIKNRSEKKVKELMRLVKKGDIDIGGVYVHPLTGLCSHEELIRLIYYAEYLRRKYKIKLESAILTDTPSYTWGFSSVLSRGGIKYASVGINNFAWGNFHKKTNLKTPFYWLGPDNEKVLIWFMHNYAHGHLVGINQSYEKTCALLPKYLEEVWGDSGYPFDVLLLHGSHGDNARVDNYRACGTVREWNRRWAYPRLVISTNSGFFKHLEQKYGNKIPKIKGDWGSYWEDGPASSAYETALNRQTHNRINNAEKYSVISASLKKRWKYPAEDIRKIYEDMIMYDEHTWGADGSITKPDSTATKGSWAFKTNFAYRAALTTEKVLKESIKAIESLVSVKLLDLPALVVLNPMVWERTDIIEMVIEKKTLENNKVFKVVDSLTGRDTPCQILEWSDNSNRCRFLFVARDVPPMGYRTYRVIPGTGSVDKTGSVLISGKTMENKFYRLSLDPVTGGISSIYDKQLKKEIVDLKCPHKFNQYIYDEGIPPGTFADVAICEPEYGQRVLFPDDRYPRRHKRYVPYKAVIEQGENGPVRSSLVSTVRAKGCSGIRQEVILYRDLKRIDIINRLVKKHILNKEGVYYAFPFKVNRGQFTCELPGAIMRPETDQISGAGRDWYAVQNWVNIAGSEYGVTWAPREAHLVEFGDINSGRWLKRLKPANTTLFSYIMNNYWWTNFRVGQGGNLTFSYAITSYQGRFRPTDAVRFGHSYNNPLDVILLDKASTGRLSAAKGSFCEINRKNVIVSSIKKAENGQGFIVRLFEVEGKSGKIEIRFPCLQSIKAHLTGMLEENIKSLPVTKNAVKVKIESFALTTIRVEERGKE